MPCRASRSPRRPRPRRPASATRPPPARAEAADRVGLVDEHARAVAAGELHDALQRAPRRRPSRTASRSRSVPGGDVAPRRVALQQAFEVVEVAVAVDVDLGACASRQASMIEAWLSSSEKILPPRPASAPTAPRLAR